MNAANDACVPTVSYSAAKTWLSAILRKPFDQYSYTGARATEWALSGYADATPLAVEWLQEISNHSRWERERHWAKLILAELQ